MLRKTLFWVHLTAGVIVGLVIAIMAITGASMVFEKEILASAEYDIRHVLPPEGVANRLPLTELLRKVREVQSDVRPSSIAIYSDPTANVAITFGRDNTYFVDPYNGTVRKPASNQLHAFFQFMERVHRFLGLNSEASRPIGKTITGVCNLAFLFLAISGLYLWWPRKWTWRSFKALAVFNLRLKGKPRDFNWHNSVGLWTAPLLIVITLTAIPISYRWGNNLLYRLTGTEPPAQGPGPNSAGNSPHFNISKPTADAKPLSYENILSIAESEFPDWSEITFRLEAARGPGNGSRREGPPHGSPASTAFENSNPKSQTANSAEQRPRGPQAVTLSVRTKTPWPLFSSITLVFDPFSGKILQKEPFSDQNAGRRLRAWTRFLHTGEALGWPGKLLAAFATLATMLLVWTGLALSWRRLKMRKQDS